MISYRHTGKYVVHWDNISKGTRLKVHDVDWFDNMSSKYSDECGGYYTLMCTLMNGFKKEVSFTESMIDRCGSVVTVAAIIDNHIEVYGCESFCWYPEMFEEIVDQS